MTELEVNHPIDENASKNGTLVYIDSSLHYEDRSGQDLLVKINKSTTSIMMIEEVAITGFEMAIMDQYHQSNDSDCFSVHIV